jgi:RNA polymerase primary sigma factor
MLVLERNARRSVAPIDSYFLEIDEATLLNNEEERDLAWRIQEGDKVAREQMIKANLRLVVSIARRCLGRGLCLADLIQEGNLGLVHAAERFDPCEGTRFSTYAKFWIQEALNKAVQKSSGPVRVPGYANHLMNEWRNATVILRDELGRNPTDREVANRLQLSERQLTIVLKAQRIHRNDTRDDYDAFRSLTSAIVDSRTPAPDAHMSADDEARQVIELLNQLPQREATILRLRFGLNGNAPATLFEIGHQLDLTRERVRQLEKSAIVKLRELIESAA